MIRRIRKDIVTAAVAGLASFWFAGQALAEEDLAKELANPISSLISVPFQGNYDTKIGPAEKGDRLTVNVQPVVPIPLSDEWNMISRTIVPITYQDDIAGMVAPFSGEQFGLGDTTQSLFFSPAQVGPSGIIWGAGPVFLLPTGTDKLLSADKWGAGPTAVVLKQTPGATTGDTLTVGALVNHIWSFAGSDRTSEISSTFMQPFISYSTYNGYTFAENTETSYNWTADEWTVPINMSVSKLTTIGNQPVSLQLGGRWWAVSPTAGPEDFGLRFGITFLFPSGG